MDDFCLETYLIPSLFQIGKGKHFCKIYDKDHIAIYTKPNRYFICDITTGHISKGDSGCYLVEWALLFKNSGLRLRKSYACYQNIIHDIKAAIHYENSVKRENKMAYENLKLKLLDDLCDKLDESGIEGNIIQRDSYGRPYVNIWYGKFENPPRERPESFTVLVTNTPSMMTSRGCFEIKPPNKYYDYFIDTFRACASRRGGFYVMSSDEIVRTIKFLFNREKMEKKKENNIMEITLATYLFDKLKENKIRYKFIDGIYNTEEIVITTKTNRDICRVRYIPNSESEIYAYEAYWIVVTSRKINRITSYRTSDMLIKDILSVERDLEYTSIPSDVVLYVYGVVDVIFNDPATIVIWADGTKTVVKANGEKFDPEKGLAMAISKKVLGNKHNYYDIFKKHVGRYEKKQAKKTKKTKKEN